MVDGGGGGGGGRSRTRREVAILGSVEKRFWTHAIRIGTRSWSGPRIASKSVSLRSKERKLLRLSFLAESNSMGRIGACIDGGMNMSEIQGDDIG